MKWRTADETDHVGTGQAREKLQKTLQKASALFEHLRERLMRQSAILCPQSRFLAIGLAAILLSGCAGGSGSTQSSGSIGDKMLNVLAMGTPNPEPAPPPRSAQIKVDCPEIEVLDGASAMRVYGGGQGNANVRYQYSMGDVARECQVANGELIMKIGVEGRVLIGPAGNPGTFSVPVRIAIRRESDQKAAASKLYRVAATVPPGETQASFNVVSDPMSVPYSKARADEDYTIVIGFDQKGGGEEKATRKRRR